MLDASVARAQPRGPSKRRRRVKRSTVNARTYWSQCRALMLKAVTHDTLILYALSEPSTQAE